MIQVVGREIFDSRGDHTVEEDVTLSSGVHGWAAESRVPCYASIGGTKARELPVPMLNVLNGGTYADNNVDIQECMILPGRVDCFAAAGHAKRSADDMIARDTELVDRYPILSIEDGLAENDWDGWHQLTTAHVVVAYNTGQIKTGSLLRTDRTAKYNQLVRIESQPGTDARSRGLETFYNIQALTR